MPPLIDESRFDEIRAAINITLDADNLPDDLISKPLFLEQALQWVASRTTETNEHAQRAAIYKTAALLVWHIPQVSSERESTGESYTVENVDLAKLESKLEGRAESQIQLANGAVTASSATPPTMFTVARGYRGR